MPLFRRRQAEAPASQEPVGAVPTPPEASADNHPVEGSAANAGLFKIVRPYPLNRDY